jgi:hypothetical protein
MAFAAVTDAALAEGACKISQKLPLASDGQFRALGFSKRSAGKEAVVGGVFPPLPPDEALP